MLRSRFFAKLSVKLSTIVATGIGAAGLVTVVFAGPANAASLKQNVSRSETTETDLSASAGAELINSADRMQKTVAELRTIVDAMPGPGLPPTPPAIIKPATELNPVAEILARIGRLEILVTEIARIFTALPAMPSVAASAALPVKPLQALPPAATLPIKKPTLNTEPSPLDSSDWWDSWLVRICFAAIALLLIAILLIKRRKNRLALDEPLETKIYTYLPADVNLPAQKTAATIKAKPDFEAPPLTDEALELADIMTSMGLADGAATALVERIRSNPRQALSHWIKLLEIYRHSGSKAKFEDTAHEVHTKFNVQPGDWRARLDPNPDASLETYPHIAEQVKNLWPTPECSEYLLGLLADNRDGKRAGFPLPVVEEIVLLLAILRSENG